MLTSFWFSTQGGFGKGYGVTAYSLGDARQLLAAYGYPRENELVENIVENVKFDVLDQNHVTPNSGPMTVRGVWYPMLNV